MDSSMRDRKLKAAILVVSDTAYEDPTSDKSGQTLLDTFTTDGNEQWDVEELKIVADNVVEIQKWTKCWCDSDVAMNLVVTTGGTGFAVKDRTPEAVGPLIHRHAPGLVHGMLAASLEVTPFALMSRPVAGVRNKTLIITLPGSPKGARENLQAVLKLLPHACWQALGASSRTLHTGGVKKLEQEAGVSSKIGRSFTEQRHHHHHDHGGSHGSGGHVIPKARTDPATRPVPNDPRAGPTRRHRESPYPMLSVEEATAMILQHTPDPTVSKFAINGDLVGHVLAEDVKAKEAVPAFRASIVDGYAVIVSKNVPSTKGTFPVVSVSHAAPGEIPALQPGQITRITTGAPLPPGSTSVVMVEDTVLKSTTEDGKEEKEVEILTDKIQPNENVREIGSDIQAGEVILQRGEEITAVGGELGLLASVGQAEVLVYKKPIVGVLSTGDEITQHDRPGDLRLGEVRDCNRPTIMAAVRGWGYDVVDLGIARDKPTSLEHTLRTALLTVTTIITTGGVSMGELDLLKPTIEHSLNGTIHFGRVAMKPGKPTTFATIPFKNPSTGDHELRLIFSLPGNPASAVVTLHLFVLPCLQRASGVRPGREGLPRVKVALGSEVRCDNAREEYHRVVLRAAEAGEGSDGGEEYGDGCLVAESTGGQRSSRVGSLRSANALVRVPAREGVVAKGERLEALVMGRIA